MTNERGRSRPTTDSDGLTLLLVGVLIAAFVGYIFMLSTEVTAMSTPATESREFDQVADSIAGAAAEVGIRADLSAFGTQATGAQAHTLATGGIIVVDGHGIRTVEAGDGGYAFQNLGPLGPGEPIIPNPVMPESHGQPHTTDERD